MKRFEDKSAFVTGAASGMGQATAIRLASEGASLYLVDLNEGGLAETKAKCEAHGATVVTRKLDVTDEAAATEAIEDCVAQFGKLDVLCNIAGVLVTAHFADTTTDQLDFVYNVNVKGPFVLCKAAMPHLIASKGNIVNCASTSSIGGLAYGVAYSASKGAILAMTRSLAVEFAKQGIRANTIIPGSVATPMATGAAPDIKEDMDFGLMARPEPLSGETGTPEQIASVVAMVASDDGAYMTGASLRIDGGGYS